jgi:hypothetical protein
MKPALCTGRVVTLRPYLAHRLGLAQALLFWQLLYLSTNGFKGDAEPVRISYTRLQTQFPFFTRRWLIEIVGRLERRGAVEVLRTGRVNRLAIVGEYELGPEPNESEQASMLVFPELACKTGLREAIALQQIHLRHHGQDGSAWAKKSLTEWHTTVFPYLGLATVKRLFARLRGANLIFARVCDGNGIPILGYRVNYVRLADVLNVPMPEHPKVAAGIVNPLYPLDGNSELTACEKVCPTMDSYPTSITLLNDEFADHGCIPNPGWSVSIVPH